VAAAFLVAVDEPKTGVQGAQAHPGWSTATDGSGIPVGQNASEYAAGVDREVTHGGRASMSMRSVVAKPGTFRSVTQFVKADAYRGKRVRFAGYLKTRDVTDWCGLWLRVDGQGSQLGFDNMQSRAFKGTNDWTRHETVLDVPEAAVRLAFGSVLAGPGQVWADDLTLEVVDAREVKSTQPVEPKRNFAERPSNLDFEATGSGAALPVPGWTVLGRLPESYSHRVAELGAHGGRGFLEVKSTQQGTPRASFATQDIAAGPYQGRRVRFSAHLKTESVSEEAYLWVGLWSKQPSSFAATTGKELKGTRGWQPYDVVVDVPADAEGLSIAAILRGVGMLGVDDASIEIVDPSKVPLTTESERRLAEREKRARELKEALAKLPDRPENLDFEQ
jgi:hypothetical protein